jgi:hypothetical protein
MRSRNLTKAMSQGEMMRQVTLVALYGEKPTALSELILACQKQIAAHLGDDFVPYEIAQVHATILGLERISTTGHFNLNFARHRNQERLMDFAGWLTFMQTSNKIPFQVQIGGFQNQDYPFTSRGEKPCDRCFSIQGNKVVLMGWPIGGQVLTKATISTAKLIPQTPSYPTVIDDLRLAGQNFNILHTYHRKPTDVDNDFYFRIGLLRPSYLKSELKITLENSLREFLSSIEPVMIEVTRSLLYIAAYTDETLPSKSTQVWSVDNINLNSDLIENLYDV